MAARLADILRTIIETADRGCDRLFYYAARRREPGRAGASGSPLRGGEREAARRTRVGASGSRIVRRLGAREGFCPFRAIERGERSVRGGRAFPLTSYKRTISLKTRAADLPPPTPPPSRPSRARVARSAARGSVSRDSLDGNRTFRGRKTQSHIIPDAAGERDAFVRR